MRRVVIVVVVALVVSGSFVVGSVVDKVLLGYTCTIGVVNCTGEVSRLRDAVVSGFVVRATDVAIVDSN